MKMPAPHHPVTTWSSLLLLLLPLLSPAQPSTLQHHSNRLETGHQQQEGFRDTIIQYWHGGHNWSASETLQLTFDIAGFYLNTGVIDSALLFYDLALPLAANTSDEWTIGDVQRIKGQLLSSQDRHREALQQYSEAYPAFLRSRDTLYMVETLQGQALCYRALGKLDSAETRLQKIIELKRLQGSEEGLQSIYTLAANVKWDLGMRQQAFAYQFKAMEIVEAQKDTFQIILKLQNLCNFYLRQSETAKAQELALRAMALVQQTSLVTTKGHTYQILGDTKAAQDSFQLALEYYDQALALYKIRDKQRFSADVYHRKGQVFQTLEDYDEALLHYRRALKIYEKNEIARGIITVQTAVAGALLETGRAQAAERTLDPVRILAEKNPILPQLKELYLTLSDIKAARGKDGEAYRLFERYHTLKDSIHNLGHLRVVAELETNYQKARKEREIVQLQSNATAQNNRIRRMRFFIYAMAGALILLLFFSVFLYRNVAKNKIIAAQREELNRQRINELKQEQELIALHGMVEGQVSERKRMALELHDGLGDLLSSTKRKFENIGHSGLATKDRTAYEKGNQLLDIAFQELRKISHNTMPGAITRFGLLPALQDACRALQYSQHIPVDLQLINFDGKISEPLAINIYRIIQELLNNISKHARATGVIVQLAKQGQNIQLTVEDNGVGFHPGSTQARQGLGLRSIQSRVNYLEGTLEIHSIPQRGTTFYITIPVNKEKPEHLPLL